MTPAVMPWINCSMCRSVGETGPFISGSVMTVEAMERRFVPATVQAPVQKYPFACDMRISAENPAGTL